MTPENGVRTLAGDDLLAQREHRLRGRDDVQHRLALLLIQVAEVRVHFLEIHGMPGAQFLDGDRVVVDLGGPLHGWLVNVSPQPNGLDEDADVLVVLQRQQGEVLDARVGEEGRRQSESIHFARPSSDMPKTIAIEIGGACPWAEAPRGCKTPPSPWEKIPR